MTNGLFSGTISFLLTVDWSVQPQDKEDCPWHQLITPVLSLGDTQAPVHVGSAIKTQYLFQLLCRIRAKRTLGTNSCAWKPDSIQTAVSIQYPQYNICFSNVQVTYKVWPLDFYLELSSNQTWTFTFRWQKSPTGSNSKRAADSVVMWVLLQCCSVLVFISKLHLPVSFFLFGLCCLFLQQGVRARS